VTVSEFRIRIPKKSVRTTASQTLATVLQVPRAKGGRGEEMRPRRGLGLVSDARHILNDQRSIDKNRVRMHGHLLRKREAESIGRFIGIKTNNLKLQKWKRNP